LGIRPARVILACWSALLLPRSVYTRRLLPAVPRVGRARRGGHGAQPVLIELRRRIIRIARTPAPRTTDFTLQQAAAPCSAPACATPRTSLPPSAAAIPISITLVQLSVFRRMERSRHLPTDRPSIRRRSMPTNSQPALNYERMEAALCALLRLSPVVVCRPSTTEAVRVSSRNTHLRIQQHHPAAQEDQIVHDGEIVSFQARRRTARAFSARPGSAPINPA